MLKRFSAFAIALIVLIAAVPLSVYVSAGELCGDVNKDGFVNASDYALVKRSVLGTYHLNAKMLAASDINADGYVTAIDYALLKRSVLGTYEITQTEKRTPVSYGKKYTISTEPGSGYPDSYNCELTDSANAVSASYSDPAFVGIASDFEIVLDLDSDGKYINGFAVSYLDVNTAGIYAPRSVTVYGSADNSFWQDIGEISIPYHISNTVTKASLELNGEVDFRYIKFSVSRRATWVFIDEVYVYADKIDHAPFVSTAVNNAYLSDGLTDSARLNEASKAFNGTRYDPSKGTSLVSETCPYSISCKEYDWRTGANSSLLTDGGVTGLSFDSRVWVGVSLSGSAEAVVDLGSVRNDICAFSVHCFRRSSIDINLPSYIDVAVSSDGKNYYTVGRSYALTSDTTNYTYSLSFKELISAEYVRFTLAEGEGFCWIEELEVYSNIKARNLLNTVYGDFDLDISDSPIYWEAGSDYNSLQTLSTGAPYEIIGDVAMDIDSYGDSNTSEEAGLLTNGVTTNDTYCYNGYWNQFHLGSGRTVVIDLGKISSVSAYSIRFLKRTDWAIKVPSNIKFALSENGKDWYLAEEKSGISGADKSIVAIRSELGRSYRARYALIYIPVSAHVFIDEIEIIGKKNYKQGVSLASGSLPEYIISSSVSSDNGYLESAPSVLGGAKDITLVYHNSAATDENYFLPYVAYLDENGNIKDTMFDGYLFLPSTAELPSGGRPYGTNLASDWNYLFDDLFSSDRSFAALDRTAEKVKRALGLKELKLKVFATIPHMDDTLEYFGDIDGDGINENLTYLETRVFVARTYAEMIIGEFERQGYSNLELCGFYWFHEAISGGDAETAKAVNECFDKLGYPMFWIPYYRASGFSKWKEYGFDAACLQPNYAFSLSVDKSRLYYASELAKQYEMCIEIEISNACFGDDRYIKKYMDYLCGGIEYGYMKDAVHMYYQGYDDFARACKSSEEKIRRIYDYTYLFIKGALSLKNDTASDISFSTVKNSFYSGTVGEDNSDTVYYILSESPKHGMLAFANDGSFVYYPNKGYTGSDSFKYRISNYIGLSDECSVNIQVK